MGEEKLAARSRARGLLRCSEARRARRILCVALLISLRLLSIYVCIYIYSNRLQTLVYMFLYIYTVTSCRPLDH